MINKRTFLNIPFPQPGRMVAIGVNGMRNFYCVRTENNKFMLRFIGEFDSNIITKIKFKIFELEVQEYSDKSLCFTLHDQKYLNPFFVTVCNDILKSIKKINEESDQKKFLQFVKVVKDWNDFFKKTKTLSEKEQIGLIGELLFMKNVINFSNVSTAVKAWTSQDKQDFSYNSKAFEVKTTTVTKNSKVSISSGEQLDTRHSKIVLVFVQIDKTNPKNNKGFTLSSLINEIHSLITELPEIFAEFNNKLLKEKNIIDHNQYNQKFYVTSGDICYFDVNNENFPKIKLPLKDGILNLRYDISISNISDFSIKTEEISEHWRQ